MTVASTTEMGITPSTGTGPSCVMARLSKVSLLRLSVASPAMSWARPRAEALQPRHNTIGVHAAAWRGNGHRGRRSLASLGGGRRPRLRLLGRVELTRVHRHALPFGDRFHDALLAGLGVRELAQLAPILHDSHAIAALDNLLQFRGDHEDARALLARQLVDQPLDLGLGAHVDTTRRLV